MARPRTIDREQLLDAAERIVSSAGAPALSFGGVAAAAGVSKATVQSAFGTRENLIEAMLDRWLQREQQRFDRSVGASPTQSDRVRAHIQATAAEPTEASSRMAALLAMLAGSGHQANSAVRWYENRAGDFAATTPEERHMRLAFLAAEGAFFVRHLAGIPMSEQLWHEIFDDLRAFTEGRP